MLSNPLHRFSPYHAIPTTTLLSNTHVPAAHMQGMDALAQGSHYALQQLQQHVGVHNPHLARPGQAAKHRQNPYGPARAGSAAGPIRRRISRACDQCNQLRTKCDGQHPCAHCIGCEYIRERKKRGKASRKDLAQQAAAQAAAAAAAAAAAKGEVQGGSGDDQNDNKSTVVGAADGGQQGGSDKLMNELAEDAMQRSQRTSSMDSLGDVTGDMTGVHTHHLDHAQQHHAHHQQHHLDNAAAAGLDLSGYAAAMQDPYERQQQQHQQHQQHQHQQQVQAQAQAQAAAAAAMGATHHMMGAGAGGPGAGGPGAGGPAGPHTPYAPAQATMSNYPDLPYATLQSQSPTGYSTNTGSFRMGTSPLSAYHAMAAGAGEPASPPWMTMASPPPPQHQPHPQYHQARPPPNVATTHMHGIHGIHSLQNMHPAMHPALTGVSTGSGSAGGGLAAASSTGTSSSHMPSSYNPGQLRYPVLEPLVPHLSGIIPLNLACDLIDLYFTSSSSAQMHPMSPYVLGFVFRKRSFLHPTKPRVCQPALLASMLWVAAQTSDLPFLASVPSARGKVCQKLLELTVSLLKPLIHTPAYVHDLDNDDGLAQAMEAPVFDGVSLGGLGVALPGSISLEAALAHAVSIDPSGAAFGADGNGNGNGAHSTHGTHGVNDASANANTNGSSGGAFGAAGNLDDVITYIHLATVVSASEYKGASVRWWNAAWSLARELKLGRELPPNATVPQRGQQQQQQQNQNQNQTLQQRNGDGSGGAQTADMDAEGDDDGLGFGDGMDAVGEDGGSGNGHGGASGGGSGSHVISEEEREERRRTWWLAYIVDRHLALCYNRPLFLLDMECEGLLRPMDDTAWQNGEFGGSGTVGGSSGNGASGEDDLHKTDPIVLASDATDAVNAQAKNRRRGPTFECSGHSIFGYFLPLMTILGEIVDLHHARNHPRFGLGFRTSQEWDLQVAEITRHLALYEQSLKAFEQRMLSPPALAASHEEQAAAAAAAADASNAAADAGGSGMNNMNNMNSMSSMSSMSGMSGMSGMSSMNSMSGMNSMNNMNMNNMNMGGTINVQTDSVSLASATPQEVNTPSVHSVHSGHTAHVGHTPVMPRMTELDIQTRIVTAYGTHVMHVLHILLAGKWDPVNLLDDNDLWISSQGFITATGHAVSAAEAISSILDYDPGLEFMPFFFGIYLLQGSFLLLLIADKLQLEASASVVRACETIIRAHEACVVTLSTEYQRNFSRVMRSALAQVRGRVPEDLGEQHMRRRELLALYRWTRDGTGLAL